MSVGQAIFGRLTGDSGVAGLIDNRVVPLQGLQKSKYPLVAYQTDSSNYDKTYAGPSGLSSHSITIACIAVDFDGAEALGKLVRVLIDAKVGTWGGQVVKGCFVDDADDAVETTIAADSRVWRKDIHATIWLGC